VEQILMRFPVPWYAVARILGLRASPVFVRRNLPLLENALVAERIYTIPAMIAAIATAGIENSTFAPGKQRGSPKYLANYDHRTDFGNTQPGDGSRFRGRGFIQLRGRRRYQEYGELLQLPLVTEPDLALEPENAARILALHFRKEGLAHAADAGAWDLVRKGVSPTMARYADFMKIVDQLLALALANVSRP
jgi:putative chitinase